MATKLRAGCVERRKMQRLNPWHGTCQLQFTADAETTHHQGGCTAPFKLMRAERGVDGRCELPLLHSAGGLVGGDQLSVDLELQGNSRALVTSVAAQKVYGSIGRSRLNPKGAWTKQSVQCRLGSNSDLEWLPQELVVYADGLVEQTLDVQLADSASFLSAEIVRLGRTAAGEDLGQGCWRSAASVRRIGKNGSRWEQVDRLELRGDALDHPHGLNGDAVFGTLIWAAPKELTTKEMTTLLRNARESRDGLRATQMNCSSLEQGLIARYLGNSSRDARFWFSRIWALTRQLRELSEPKIPRVWPLQESPLVGYKSESSLIK